MSSRPDSKAQLAQELRAAQQRGAKLALPDLSGLNRVLQYTPEDMTVKAECGLTLGALQERLGAHKQWLPIDPPHAERLSLAELISADANGPRRYGYGGIREHLIGLQVALADGRLVSSGGNVVKNVAGYDLLKLFIGARHSLGVPVEACFKLRPRPEQELFLASPPGSPAEAESLTESVIASDLTPVVLDWHRGVTTSPEAVQVVLGLAGTREDVGWQRTRALALGFRDETDLDHENRFWSAHAAVAGRRSVLPSRLAQAVAELDPGPLVARAGNGVIYAPGLTRALRPPGVATLTQRIKDTFDPKHILPDAL